MKEFIITLPNYIIAIGSLFTMIITCRNIKEKNIQTYIHYAINDIRSKNIEVGQEEVKTDAVSGAARLMQSLFNIENNDLLKYLGVKETTLTQFQIDEIRSDIMRGKYNKQLKKYYANRIKN